MLGTLLDLSDPERGEEKDSGVAWLVRTFVRRSTSIDSTTPRWLTMDYEVNDSDLTALSWIMHHRSLAQATLQSSRYL